MQKRLNIGNKESSLELLKLIKETKYAPFDLRIMNAHLLSLNRKIGRTIFRKDALYINSNTLWEIMQPIGGVGKRHYHELSPQDILDTLRGIKDADEVNESYDGRYVIITLVMYQKRIPIAIILEPRGQLIDNTKAEVARVITMYPYNKK